MCRKIWEKGNFPQNVEEIPLHKKKDTMNCDNYRGVDSSENLFGAVNLSRSVNQ